MVKQDAFTKKQTGKRMKGMQRKNRELRQTSETFVLSAILALSGGFDYDGRGHARRGKRAGCGGTNQARLSAD